MTHEGRCINDAQSHRTLQRQIRLQRTLASQTERDCADRMVDRIGLVADIRVELLVRLSLSECTELANDVVRPGWSGDEATRSPDRTSHDCQVDFRAQQVRVHERKVEGIGRCQRNIPPYVREKVSPVNYQGKYRLPYEK